jgi:glucokinase
MSLAAYLAVDIGGSKFICGLVSPEGKILESKKTLWSEKPGSQSPGGIVADIKTAARKMLAIAAERSLTVRAAGATIPGLADPEKGLWVEASFSGVRNLPIADILCKEFGLPFFVENDVNACALAEKAWGCAKDSSDFIWVTVSNGIGGCVFADGKLYRGGAGNAGEIGHVIVEEGPHARQCKTGHYGCAEIQASGRALAMNFTDLGGSAVLDGEPCNAKSIAALLRKGGEGPDVQAARAAYDLEGLYLGRAIGAAVNVLNPQKVIIGGGVSLDFDLFRAALEKSLAAHIYRTANPSLTVEASPLGNDAGLLGAAVLSCK